MWLLFLSADTESLYTESTQQILDRYGLTFEWAVKAKMMGRRPLDAAQVLVDALQLPLTAKEFHTELYGNLMKKFPNAKLLPGMLYTHKSKVKSWDLCFTGAETLIRHLRSHGIPTAIATGSAQSSYEVKISQYGDLFGGMSHAVCSDDPDVKEGKPSPYIYQVAASRFQTAPKSSANVNTDTERFKTVGKCSGTSEQQPKLGGRHFGPCREASPSEKIFPFHFSFGCCMSLFRVPLFGSSL